MVQPRYSCAEIDMGIYTDDIICIPTIWKKEIDRSLGLRLQEVGRTNALMFVNEIALTLPCHDVVKRDR